MAVCCIAALSLAGCVNSGKDHTLDADATAATQWAVGEEVVEGNRQCFLLEGWGTCEMYRKFLGVTRDGYYLVQDFYAQDDVKLTDPYLLLHKEEVSVADFSPFALQVEGRYVEWHTNGHKWYEGQFADGKVTGVWSLWHGNGEKAAQGSLEGDNEQGVWTYWYENGQKSSEGAFVNGEQVGLWTQWYENGKKKAETHFVEGKVHGLWTEWHDNGMKKAEGLFDMDKPVGVWREWDDASKLLREENRG